MILPNLLVELSKLPSDEINSLGMDFSKLKIFTGGSVFNATNTHEILAKMGVKAIIQGYGSTEVGIITMDNASNFVPGSAGLVTPNVEVKVKYVNQECASWVTGKGTLLTYLLLDIAGCGCDFRKNLRTQGKGRNMR